MITFVEGILDEKQPTRAVVNVQGLGYEVLIPVSSYETLPSEGDRVRVLTYLQVREDAQVLFGFSTEDEREMFKLLITINGIGPKLAVSVLSGLSVRELKAALVEGNVKQLCGISGVGKKTAERMVVELRDKFGSIEQLELAGGSMAPEDDRLRDTAAALISLGFKQEKADKMITKLAKKITPECTIESLLRAALASK
ncbi:Holliday junction branch migration protein RuvA [Verrucomicrobiota bacterium]